MYEADITRAASAICGEESELIGLLASAAAEELQHMLKDGVTPDMCSEAFIAAGALLAAASYLSVDGASAGVDSYSAGRVKVTRCTPAAAAAAAENLRMQAEMLISAYTEDGGFCFKGVDG